MAAVKKKSKARTALDAMFADQTADLPDPSYRSKEKRLGIVVDITRKQDTAPDQSEQDDQPIAGSLPLVADSTSLVIDGLPLVDEPVADGLPLVDEPVTDRLPPVSDGRPLVADGLSPVSHIDSVDKTTPHSEQNWIPLSPLQWQVWEVLLSADTEQRVVSYKQIAGIAKASIQGVRKAFGVLEKEDGILKRQTIRERTVQGLRLIIDRARPFRQVTLRDTQALLRRESVTSGKLSATSDAPSATVTSGRPLRMYVCKKNTYIQADDLKTLLREPPAAWQIREQTLVQIADAFPTMTALEFRLSLRRLSEQATTGRTIQNPNAWLKAAFEKNGGPLVTEREVEARLEQGAEKKPPKSSQPAESPADDETAVLRRYLAASATERAEIDQLAEERARPLLARVSEDKHAGIREQAKIEAAKEFVAKRPPQSALTK